MKLFDKIYWAIQLERLKLFLFQTNLMPAHTKRSSIDQSIDALVGAEHICPRCKFLDGTSCLFSLDVGYDKVVRCHEFQEPEKKINRDVKNGY